MAVKTFTTGEVLTASDTNTYLNNGGLVYITSTTATIGTSISVNSCYTSTYTNYRVIAQGNVGTGGEITMRLRTGITDDSAATYKWGRTYFRIDNGASGVGGSVAASEATIGLAVASTQFFTVFDVFNPQVATQTMWSTQPYVEPNTATSNSYLGFAAGQKNTTSQYDGISLFFPGTISSVTITIMGYRKA